MKITDITNIQELSAQQTQVLKGGARDTGRGDKTSGSTLLPPPMDKN